MRTTIVALIFAVVCLSTCLQANENGESKQEFLPPNGEQLAPSVYFAGFSHRFENANCGWIELADRTLLIDLPRGLDIKSFSAYVAESTGKPVRSMVLTSERESDRSIVEELQKLGVTRIDTAAQTSIGDATVRVKYIPYVSVTGVAGGAVYLPRQGILFGGPAIVHGPRVNLTESDTAGWLKQL